MPSQPAHKPPHPPTLSSTGIFPNAAFLSSTERTGTHRIQQNVPILPVMTGNITTSPPSDRAHSRSISHPFPAPFSKRRNQPASHPEFLDSDDDDDDELQMPHIPDLLSSSPRKGSSRPVPGGEVNSTGKCMTCNSTVRWPRGLKVFRCTECLTVNDLEPYTSSDVKAGTAGKPGASIPRKAIPLSVERTKSIIDGCISTYLRRILDAPVPRKFEARNGGNPSIVRQDENRSYIKSQSPGLLSAPRVDARARSSSASGRPGRPEWLHGTSNHLKPISNPLAPSGDGTDSRTRSRNNSDVQARPKANPLPRDAGRPSEPERSDQSSHPYIFKPLEEYIISSFKGCACLNASFTTTQPPPPTSVSNVSSVPKPTTDTNDFPSHAHPSVEPDAKTLLIGDLGENSSWWMNDDEMAQASSHGQPKGKPATTSSRTVTSRNPRINWSEVTQWYHLILTAGTSWIEPWSAMNPPDEPTEEAYHRCKRWETANLSMMEKDFAEARLHLHRTLLKVTENLLKRPRRPLQKPEDVRFLLILLANPLIYPSSMSMGSVYTASPAVRSDRRPSHPKDSDARLAPRDVKPPRKEHPGPPAARGGVPSHHFGIIKRIVGLIAHLPNGCHHYLVSWFSRFSTGQFEKLVDLVGSFVTYRLGRQHGRKRSEVVENDNSLVPSFNSAAGNTPAELHAAINGRGSGKPAKDSRETPVVYGDDWQIRAAARLMSLLFTANITHVARKPDAGLGQEAVSANRAVAIRRGHKIPISSFYNTLLDYSDLVADFEAWESKTTKFSFCQYPYFLSIWAKIHIMEHDARRQMEVKAREAFFNSILSRKAVSQYLVLKVRRDCLVDDSLRSVSEVVGSSQEEIKKGLRIEFVGEEGVDAGGLRKEWFLLLVREIFDPHHGLFLYDEDSQFCYFNPFCFESSEQFFLVGVLLGLAIYNSTILDIALPPFAFKKLLAAAPASSGPQPVTTSRSNFKCTLDDLAEYRPALAKGLRGLLEFDGDVTETFCYDFVAHVDRYGEIVAVPLCPEGEKRPVTNANRREFVDLYVHYMLDTAVTRQFEPFKRGFFTVCGGNALSLFRPEEIELLVRGSDEPLDVASLRAVATYDNWSHPRPENVPVVRWFWDFFEQVDPQTQRKILSFITGSDRIPAMGATSLTIRVACLGDDTSRYPIARTCFNTLGLYRYATKATLERMLWEAVGNSEGFGLK